MTRGPRATMRVALSNLGCRVNRAELDAMALSLQREGVRIVGQREADAVIVNSCAVTGEAQAKTRKAVRHAARLPQHPIVVATGCVATLCADELACLGDNVIVEVDKGRVPQVVMRALSSTAAGPPSDAREPQGIAPGVTPTGRARPGIKVQDGCDNRCTYCIVWRARGPARSVAPEDVLADVRAAQERGLHEVVLTGINLGAYRFERDGRRQGLPGLLRLILAETDVGRVRLSSIEPPDVTDELLDAMRSAGERVAPFLHVCLQSGCDRTLHGMGRAYDTERYAAIVSSAREALPDVALGTDLIVGFPGETDEDFARSLSFCQQMAFARMHVFRYSRRPGTPAASRTDQVDPAVASERGAAMLLAAAEMRREQALTRLGRDELAIVQGTGLGVTGGLFDVLLDDRLAPGSLVRARVRDVRADGTLDARTSTIIKWDRDPRAFLGGA